MDVLKLYEPMMKSIIRKYLGYANKVGLEYDDLYQEASMAVLRAKNTYKDNKGMKLAPCSASFSFAIMARVHSRIKSSF